MSLSWTNVLKACPFCFHSVTCSACIATNIEALLGGSVADGEKAASGKHLHTIKISEGHSELGAFCPRSEAVNVLQTQPVFTIQVTEAINIAGPVAVEVDRAIHSPLDDLPLSVHIAVHLEGSTTTWVNGVHSRGGAATVEYLLAATWVNDVHSPTLKSMHAFV